MSFPCRIWWSSKLNNLTIVSTGDRCKLFLECANVISFARSFYFRKRKPCTLLFTFIFSKNLCSLKIIIQHFTEACNSAICKYNIATHDPNVNKLVGKQGNFNKTMFHYSKPWWSRTSDLPLSTTSPIVSFLIILDFLADMGVCMF